MTARNDITGDVIKTKGVTTEKFRSEWDRIFGANKEQKEMNEATGGGVKQEGDGLAEKSN